ncbi:MAG: bifunctional folylpolyglutamate synthase/dihydrofolate synthase [Eubacterium sp.]|nr:bifunctional folylpolyglutamate synthase/dihydrofolate synthase [Eubacterium sp.]
MNYDQSVDYLNEQKNSIIRPGLTVITELLGQLGNPQEGMRYIHIAGTNGKGSTAAYLESVLRAAGYRTGLFTSPYIEHFSEKIQVNHEDIDRQWLIDLTARVREAAEVLKGKELFPTPFELQTAVAFLYFKSMGCDIVVLETGLGGRLDATNIIRQALVTVITSISYDHMDYLGDTLEEIAAEKAGIIKKGARVVCYPQQASVCQVIQRKCNEMGAELACLDINQIIPVESDIKKQIFRFDYNSRENVYEIHLLGRHQIYNASLAIMAVDALRAEGLDISEDTLKKGLARTSWKGRLEVVHKEPLLLIDGAHNPGGVESLARSLIDLFPGRKLTFITGVLKDKDYPAMLDQMIPLAKQFYTVTPNSPRALPANVLADEICRRGCPAESFRTVKEALDKSLDKAADEVICAFGSLYFIGEVRGLIRGKQ